MVYQPYTGVKGKRNCERCRNLSSAAAITFMAAWKGTPMTSSSLARQNVFAYWSRKWNRVRLFCYPLGVVIAIRVVGTLWIYHDMVTPASGFHFAWLEVNRNLLPAGSRWLFLFNGGDSFMFPIIAMFGYAHGRYPFLPGYPILIRFAGLLVGDYWFGAFLVTQAFALGSFVMFQLLAERPAVGCERRMSKTSKKQANDTLQRLGTELDHLKQKFKMGQELELQWTPNDGPRSGEVTGTTIRIYEADPTKALDTLRHEFIEYLLTQDLVAPYKRLINKLISLFEEEMYDRKEKLVETLQELTR
jgi:hypothetical protein